MRTKRIVALVTATLAITLGISVSTAKPTAHMMMTPDQMTWGDMPSLPPGAKIAVLAGDPGKAGQFTVRLKFPAGYKIPPHHHPTAENVTVMSGAFKVGMGDKFDEAKMTALPPGSVAMLPKKMNHFAMATADTEVQLSAMGPFAITYVNKADDPRKK